MDNIKTSFFTNEVVLAAFSLSNFSTDNSLGFQPFTGASIANYMRPSHSGKSVDTVSPSFRAGNLAEISDPLHQPLLRC
jgi:hypothetical protein